MVKRVRNDSWTPVSDKEIASAFLQKRLSELMNDIDFDELRDLADKNLYDQRCEKIADRIAERLEKILVPIERYIEGRK